MERVFRYGQPSQVARSRLAGSLPAPLFDGRAAALERSEVADRQQPECGSPAQKKGALQPSLRAPLSAVSCLESRLSLASAVWT